jgi:hypothetical protein
MVRCGLKDHAHFTGVQRYPCNNAHQHNRGSLFRLQLLVVVSHRSTLSELGVALQFRDRPVLMTQCDMLAWYYDFNQYALINSTK